MSPCHRQSASHKRTQNEDLGQPPLPAALFVVTYFGSERRRRVRHDCRHSDRVESYSINLQKK